MTEFLIVCTALAVALLYPFMNGESVATMVLRALMRCLRTRSFLISVL